MSNSSNIYAKIFRRLNEGKKEAIRKGGAGKSPYTGTRIHKDKKKELSKNLSRKKVKDEDENSVGGGVLGPAAAVGNTQGDFYAPGDYRVPKALGAVQTRMGSIGGKKRRKRKKKK